MFFDKALKSLPEFAAAERDVKSDTLPAAISGLSHFHKIHIAGALAEETAKKALYLTGDEAEAARAAEDLNALGIGAVYLPSRDLNLSRAGAVSHEYENQRLYALCSVLSGKAQVLTCSAQSASQYIPSPRTLEASSFMLKKGDTVSMTGLCERLVGAGYTRTGLVEGAGQFACRGGLLDIFPSDSSNPFRIDFFGDEIDGIYVFDPESQRRGSDAGEIFIAPARELIFDPGELADKIEVYLTENGELSDETRKNLVCDADILKSTNTLPWADCYLPLLKDALSTVFDYADGLIFVSEWNKIKASLDSGRENLMLETETLLACGSVLPDFDGYLLPQKEILKNLKKAVYMDGLLYSRYDVPPRDIITMSLRSVSPWSGTVSALADDLKAPLSSGYSAVLAVATMKAARAIEKDLSAFGISGFACEDFDRFEPGKVTIVPLQISQGGEYPGAKFMLVPFKTAAAAKKRSRYKKGNAIGGLDELKRGDAVVHSVHGIGIFDGVHKIESQGVIKDYIKIKYRGSDVLYLPVTQLDLVSKYIGPSGDDAKIKLSKMGSPEWQKTKARVRGQVKDMAKELIALYSKRMNVKGYAFSEDTDLQRDFETRFEYDETEDQLRCAEEIKQDMQRPHPMDRLLCGDVGFGKTEVALRAAFKCVCDGKQCAILVPTTILALQHYTTVCRRMEGMGVRVDYISRFKTEKEQSEIIRKLSRGELDIIIGTHRLLSNDVKFFDLGLLIVDEEQRFGVGHKEKIKEKYPFVDVLTLSATPIPRTLNMAMSGLRDMSVIEEAPGDRLPVQTYVTEENTGIILDAIKRELRRGGQVYYLHNRTGDIVRKAYLLSQQLPGARVSYADGKMSENQLNSEWQKLIDHETDVLVCTTIIETGVDVPNVNTLIVEDADRFGLSQLHQIRGRVGRSSRRAYAYFTFRRGKQIGDIAAKRLEAVRDFTEFGSGFKIAMRDLEIRGAGNLLGAEQHGQMESVGYDMYIKLLSEAVAEEKGEEAPERVDCTVDLQINSHIPERYIDSLDARLDMYRKIADIRTDEDRTAVEEELSDRFGKIPKSVHGLISVSMLRNRAAMFGIYEIAQRGNDIYFYLPSLALEQVNNLYRKLGKKRYTLGGKEKPFLRVSIKKDQTPIDTMNEVLSIL